MKLIRLTLLVFSFHLVMGNLQAQPAPLRFEQFPPEVVLSHTTITSILQDHDGFLWLGTWSGLMKYDGYTVRQYKQEPGRPDGLESNKITALFEDSRQRIWIGARNSGLYQYDRSQDRFIQYRADASVAGSLSNNNVWAISEDAFGGLWVGTEHGLNLLNPGSQHFVHFTYSATDGRSLSRDFVYTIAESADSTLWIGTEVGLNRLIRDRDGKPLHFVPYSLAPEKTPEQTDAFIAHNYIYKIKPGDGTYLWIGAKAGLKKVEYSRKDLRSLHVKTYRYSETDDSSLSHNFVVDMLERPDGDLWVATFNGLNLFHPEEGRFRRFMSDDTQPNGLRNQFIRALFNDRNDILWIGTEGGLHKLNLSSKPFRTIVPDISKNAANAIVTTICRDSYGDGLWLGARGGGLNHLEFLQGDESVPTLRHFPFDTPYASETVGFISDMAVDDFGWLWITTQGSGVLKVRETDLLSGKPIADNLNQYSVGKGLANLDSEHLMSVMNTAGGDIWMGGWDLGLVRYDREQQQFFNYKTTDDFKVSLEAFPIVHLAETFEGRTPVIWAGTRGNGLLKLRYRPADDQVQLLEHYRYQSGLSGGLSNNYINCLFFDSSHQLWVGTENGLNRLDAQTHTFTYLLEKDGLANGIVQSIQEGDDGNIWISTQKGISCLTPAKGDQPYSIKNFDAYDGLQDNFFNDDAAAKTGSGELVFGGIKGLNIFAPQHIQQDTTPPTVVITDLKLFNRSVSVGPLKNGRTLLEQHISETVHLDLNYRDKVISFEFTGLHFANPQKIQYAHKLEGFDLDWVYGGSDQRIAHYTNLPYEDFTFLVKAANGDGVWSEPVSLSISIAPPFWQTGGAYLLYGLSFIGLLWGVRKITKRQAELEHNLQLERIEREKLEEVNDIKSRFFTNISHELRTPLTLILSPLEQLIKEKGAEKKLYRTLTLMHQNANRLLTMINQLLDIRKNEAGLMKLQVAEGNFVKFVKEVILSFRGLARRQQVDLVFAPIREEILLWYDRDQMEKVLFNLLSNALKHTPENGRIEVSLEAIITGNQEVEPTHLLLSVRDTGSGIPQDQLQVIFDRFYQVESGAGVPGKGGTGIGLALAKSIVEAHRGKIWAESEPGRSATFYVQLPLGGEHFSEEEKITDFQDSEAIRHYFLSNRSLEEHAIRTGERPPPQPDGKRSALLIVEDNPDIRSYLKDYLKDEYRIEEAPDGAEGLEKALAAPPDLIIADISMPNMDGIEMCAKIKSNIQTSHIPVILLTARTSLLYKIDGLETGADDYITKPFNINLLTSRIRNLIESRRQLREKFARNFDLSPSGVVMNSLDEQLLSRVKELVEKHMDDSDFSTEQLATSLHMSRMQLYRKLKVLTGKSPNQVIRTIRLQRAAQLLDTHQYNVSDVTYMVGYNDLKWFREQFRKEFGVSPSEYERKGE